MRNRLLYVIVTTWATPILVTERHFFIIIIIVIFFFAFNNWARFSIKIIMVSFAFLPLTNSNSTPLYSYGIIFSYKRRREKTWKFRFFWCHPRIGALSMIWFLVWFPLRKMGPGSKDTNSNPVPKPIPIIQLVGTLVAMWCHLSASRPLLLRARLTPRWRLYGKANSLKLYYYIIMLLCYFIIILLY